MKSLLKLIIVASLLAMAAQVYAQPASQPTVPAVTKVVSADKPTVDAPKTEAPKVEVPAPVVADEDAGLSYGKLAIKYAMQLGFLLLSLILSGFVTVLMKKFGFSAQTEKVNDVLERAKGYAEQWALKKAKVDGDAKPGGPEKMKKAVAFAIDLAQEYKLPKKGEDWWEGKLESWLGVKNS